jgi:hypothetical protein
VPFSVVFLGFRKEAKMKARLGLLALLALAGLSISAYAQTPPPGSYQRSCREIRMQGATLTAVCSRTHGREEQLTALNVAHCVGDIRNKDGQLQCNGGQPARPAPPPGQSGAPVYPGPGYPPPPSPGYPPPGYERDDRWQEERAFRENCERLRGAEHEIGDRLAYTPDGEERERLQYRLGEIHQKSQRCWRR